MSSIRDGFVGSLSDALDFKAATLSGAIDIVVVQHPDGSRMSTPFHVRFGKLQLLRPKEKLVSIRVDDKLASFHTRMGGAGEAFFVKEIEEGETAVGDEWATSPNQPPTSPWRGS
jgi:phosphatidate phosphatase LPIN